MNIDQVAENLIGHDCVLSALGAPGVHFSKVKFYLESIQSIVAAMRQAYIKRLICVTAWYTKRNFLIESNMKLNIACLSSRCFLFV